MNSSPSLFSMPSFDQAALIGMMGTLFIKIISALILLIVGFWLSKYLQKIIIKLLKRSNLGPTIISFVSNFSYYVFLVILFLLVLSQLGVETTSLIALLGTASLAVGLALQGSLSNLAAGILLVIFRYFKVGDRIEVAGIMGIVESIDILSTTICTPDNRVVTIPNKSVIESNIINHVGKPIRRLDLVIGVAYEEDIEHVKRSIQSVLNRHNDVLKSPSPKVVLGELGDSSLNFDVRPWVNSDDYLRLELELMEAIKKKLDEEKIVVPFPQRDVHFISQDTGVN